MKGIYPRENSIQIYFSWNGKPHRETLTGSDGKPLPPTPKNVAYAGKVREQILRAITSETFKLAEYFPESKSVAGEVARKSAAQVTVRTAVEQYLDSKAKSAERTSMRTYRSGLQRFVKEFGDRTISDLTFRDLDKHMTGVASQVAPNTYNAILTGIRAFFNYAILCEMTAANPAINVGTQKRPEPKPDPLMRDEQIRVIEDMRLHYHPGIVNYFELAFLLGFRPSEGIDLRWHNVDWKKGTLMITGARVWGIEKETKTHKAREVELWPRAIEILKRQLALTGTHEHGRIFESHWSGKPWYQASVLHSKFWVPSLERCKIRVRDARQTRHSAATAMLMSGCNPEGAAAQLGHSAAMFRKVYSKWVRKADEGRERGKFEEFLSRFDRAPEQEGA